MEVERLVIAYDNRVDAATLSGGSAAAGLPITNLQNTQLGRVWRSADTDPANTWVGYVDAQSRAVRAVGLINHNLSLDARYRIRGSGESAMTNLLVRTEDFTHAAWTPTGGAVVTPNVLEAPDGATTADRIGSGVPTAGVQQAVAVTAGQSYTLSAFVWEDSYHKVRLRCAAHGIEAVLDMQTGEVTTSAGGTAVATAYGDGWRLALTFAATLASIEYTLEVAAEGVVEVPGSPGRPVGLLLAITSSSGGAVGPGGSIVAWGAQLELGSGATSYYPSAATPGVRAAGYMDGWQSYDLDTGWVDVWPTVYPFGSLPWGAPNWWGGQYSAGDLERYTPRIQHDLGATYYLSSWRLELTDEDNTAGYVQAGRAFFGPAWQPLRNMDYGASLQWVDPSTVAVARSGQEYPRERRPYRMIRFTTSQLSEDEGLANAFEIQGRMGITREVMLFFNPAATVHAIRQNVYGRLGTLNPLDYPYGFTTSADGSTTLRNSTAWEFKERTR